MGNKQFVTIEGREPKEFDIEANVVYNNGRDIRMLERMKQSLSPTAHRIASSENKSEI